jgi:cell division transport system permease protein
MPFFLPGDKKLGVTSGKRQYDLPLNSGNGAGFLILLVALMTFLGVLALSATFALSSMAHHWSSGLENKMTIEIPAENAKGRIRSADEIKDLSRKIKAALEQETAVKQVDILGRDEINSLIAPWLGDLSTLPDIPLPGLISVEFSERSAIMLQELKTQLEKIVSNIVLDTHESWLADILKLTGALQFATFLVCVLIGLTTITAIAGAVKSRIAIHNADVELLHLMGASDSYISRQFQRHTLILAFKGALAGTLFGLAILGAIALFTGNTGSALLPEFKLNMIHIFSLLSLPALACIIAALTARLTVRRELALMP